MILLLLQCSSLVSVYVSVSVNDDEPLPTLKYRRIRGNMIEMYKYDDNTVHLDMNIDTRTKGHTKKLVVKRCHYDVWKYSFCIRVVNI